MKIKLNIELNKEELRLLSNQIKIEFANSNRQITQLLDYKEKENKRRYQTGFPGPKFDPKYYEKICARLNKHMQDCGRLAIVSKAFKCDEGIYNVDGKAYCVELFYDEERNIINGMKYMDMGRLAIHLMRRAGIIDKKTMSEMLSMTKEKGLLHKQKSKLKKAQSLQEAYCKFVDNIKHMTNPREYSELIRMFNVPESIAKLFGVELADVILPAQNKQQKLENTVENEKKQETYSIVQKLSRLVNDVNSSGLDSAEVSLRIKQKCVELGLPFGSATALINAIGYEETKKIALGTV